MSYARVELRTIAPTEGRRDYYDVTLHLSNYGYRYGTTGSGGFPGTNAFPHQPDPGQEHWWSGTFTMYGDAIVQLGHSDDTHHFITSPDPVIYTYHIETTTDAISGFGSAGVTLDPDVADVTFLSAGDPFGTTNVHDGTFDARLLPTGDYYLYGQIGDSTHSGTARGTLTFWIDPPDWVPIPAEPPAPGAPVNGEVVVMDGPNGRTANPFANGSLRVFVDDTDQTANVIASDPSCGDFTLSFTPTPTETVLVYYQGA